MSAYELMGWLVGRADGEGKRGMRKGATELVGWFRGLVEVAGSVRRDSDIWYVGRLTGRVAAAVVVVVWCGW